MTAAPARHGEPSATAGDAAPLLPELALLRQPRTVHVVLVQDALERRHAGRLHPAAVRGRRGGAPPVRARAGAGAGRASTRRRTSATSWRSLAFGVVAFVGYWFQNAGLERTTTSNSAFITGLFVVFTPLVETVVLAPASRRRNVLAAVVIAVVGLFLLTGADLSLNSGDCSTLGCAFFFGIWIYIGGRLSQRYDPVMLTALQLVDRRGARGAGRRASTGSGTSTGRSVVAVVVTGVVLQRDRVQPAAVGPALRRAEPGRGDPAVRAGRRRRRRLRRRRAPRRRRLHRRVRHPRRDAPRRVGAPGAVRSRPSAGRQLDRSVKSECE